MTSCGLPTRFAPRSVRVASNCSRDIGGQPRSRPMRSIIAAYAGYASSAAACDVSAMKPWELMLIAGRGWPISSAARRWISATGAKRSGMPPMIARASGRPSAPARTADCGAAADRDPDRERVLHGAGVHGQVVDRRPVAAAPRHALGLADLQQQLELLGEELVVVVEVVAEEGEGLDERAAPGHDLRAPVAQQVQGRELLEHADGVVRAQDAHRAGQPDVLRAPGGGAQDDGRSAHGEVGTVVLADGEDVEPEGVGELDLLDEVREALLGRDRVGGQLAEGVDADLHASTVGDAC